MKVENLSFGNIKIDGKTYREDIVIEKGKIKERNKSKSRTYKAMYGHTPLTPYENVPWECETLVIGTGIYGSLPVTEEFKQTAEQRGIKLVILPTPEAIKYINTPNTNLVLHLTC